MKAFWSVMKKSWGEHVVFLLACLLCLGVYPLGLIGHSEYVSESVDEQVYPYIGVENGNSLSGSFIPAHRQLESIGIRFSTQDRNIVDGTLLFALYDSEEEQIARQRIDCTEIKNNEYFEFEVNAELSLTEEYHFVLATYGSSDGVPCVFGGSDAIGPEEVGEFSLMDETEVTKRIPIRLRYTGRTAGKTVLVYDISILFVAMLLLFGIRRKEEGAQLLSFGGVYRFL